MVIPQFRPKLRKKKRQESDNRMIFAMDIGTTNLKAALIDAEGTILRLSEQPLPESDGFSFAPKYWLTALRSACLELGQNGLLQPDCLIICGNGPTMVTVPESDAWLWLDRRAEEESALVSAAVGLHIDASFMLPKVLYLKKHDLERYQRTTAFFETAEYLAYKLTGTARTALPVDGLQQWYWDEALLNKLQLDPAKFPPFIKTGEIIGTVTDEASIQFNIKAGTRVLAGCPDFVSAILGTGAMRPGELCDRCGTSEGINLCSVNRNDDSRLMCYRHPNGRNWNISGNITTTGKAIEKIKTLLGFSALSYAEFYAMIQNVPAGSNGVIFHPYLAGERAPIWDHQAKGMFYGLTLSTEPRDMLHAVCEGVCLAIRDVLTLFQNPVAEIRVTGGPSESDFLNQLKADVTGFPVISIENRESELTGLAILAYTALGTYPDLVTAADFLIKKGKRFEPNPALFNVYTHLYQVYKQLYTGIKPIEPSFAKIKDGSIKGIS